LSGNVDDLFRWEFGILLKGQFEGWNFECESAIHQDTFALTADFSSSIHS
jgi:hypothetical protein